MFAESWKKYLPVIAILIKRSAKEEQKLKLDEADFMRAAGGRRVRFSFDAIRIANGRTDTHNLPTPLARDFVQSLLGSDMIRVLIRNQQFEFDLGRDFQLTIKNLSTTVETLES
jgi:hypothetical protein